jgi:hypothetical protein
MADQASSKNVDPHGLRVSKLTTNGDWAALARYWMAHDHEPALDAALACVKRRVQAGETHLGPLRTYLQAVKAAPLDPGRELPASLASLVNGTDRITLELLDLNKAVALCEAAPAASPQLQTRLLTVGIAAAEQAAQAAMNIADLAVSAFFLVLLC